MTQKLNNILIAATDMSTGGLGSYLVTLAMGLKTRGWAVHLLVTNVRGNLFDSMREFVSCHDLSEFALSAGKLFKAASIVNSINPDILLMNNCSLMHYALPLIVTTTKPVAVLHSDDDRFYSTAALFSKRIFRWIGPTQGVADRFTAYLPNDQGQRVRLIPHGIDSKLFTVNRNRILRITNNICFVGYLAENKGAALLPDIFLRVSNVCRNVHFTVMGHGPLEQTLRKQCEESGIIDKCTWTGAIVHAKVAEILRDSDILLLPTRIEGFGLSIVEAMMSGAVPVVSRLKGVTDDIVTDGITGLLIEPDDKKGFADAIVSLIVNPERLVLMSEAAREAAVRKYSAERMLDGYEKLFAEEDDRVSIKRRGTIGGITETIREKVKKGIDRQWLVNRAKELWK